MIHDGEKMLDDGCHLVPGKEWLAHERSFSSLWNKSYTWVTHYHHCSLAHSDIDNAHIVTMDEIDGQVDFPQAEYEPEHNVHGAFALREKLSQVSVMQAIYEVVWRVTWISLKIRAKVTQISYIKSKARRSGLQRKCKCIYIRTIRTCGSSQSMFFRKPFCVLFGISMDKSDAGKTLCL